MCCEHISPKISGSNKISPKTSNPQVVKLIRTSLQKQAQSRGKTQGWQPWSTVELLAVITLNDRLTDIEIDLGCLFKLNSVDECLPARVSDKPQQAVTSCESMQMKALTNYTTSFVRAPQHSTDGPFVAPRYLTTNLIHGEKCVISQDVLKICPISRKIHGRSFRNSRKIHAPHRRYFEVLC